MRISKVEISNWRSIVYETIVFNDLMIFIGQNNHGKSNILSAILFFFGEIGFQDLDFNSKSNELWIEIEFEELTENEQTTFRKYVTSANTIKVRKTALKNDTFQYNGYVEEPKEEWLKEENISDHISRENAQKLPFYEMLPELGRIKKDDFKEAQLNYIQNHKDDIDFEYQLESTNFLGAKNVAKGSFGDLFFIPSIKRASDELSPKGNSIFAQLYSRVINKMSETNEEFIQAKQKIIDLTKILNKTNEKGEVNEDRPTDLSSLEDLIDNELRAWNTKVDIQITPPNVDDIFRVGANVLIDDGIKTDIERKGHGLQRALIFALIKAWSTILKQEREEAQEQSTGEETRTRRGSKSTFFVFEEPELFLHPQAQKELFSSLVELSRDNNQVLICTHSSSFLDLKYHTSICIVKKNDVAEGSKVLQCNEDIFTDLDDKKKFNLGYWINPDRSELFFAKKVILVEGQTDKSVIPMIAKELGIYKYSYTIVDCGSKDSIPQYINLLNKFKLNYIAVYDKDHQEGKDESAKASADKSSKLIEDGIDVSIGNSIIFDNDIEEELGMTEKVSSGKAYKAIMFVDSDSFNLSNNLKSKIETIFE